MLVDSDEDKRQRKIGELRTIIKQKEIYHIGGISAKKERLELEALLREERN